MKAFSTPLGYVTLAFARSNPQSKSHRLGWLVFVGLLLTGLPAWAQIDVSVTTPKQNALTASRDASPTVFFRTQNGVIDNASLNNFRVFSTQYGGSKAGTKSVNTNRLQFNPTQNFKPGEVVSVSVPGSISVLENGTKQAVEPYVFQFTTAAAAAPAVFNGSAFIAANQPNISKVSVADLNGDGHLDLITSGDNVKTHIRQANGSYSTQDLFDKVVSTIQPADMDSDGDIDLVMVRYDYNVGFPGYEHTLIETVLRFNDPHVVIFYNTGNGTFESVPQDIKLDTMPADISVGLTIADMNSDGKLDIITTRYLYIPHYNDNYLHYFPNDPAILQLPSLRYSQLRINFSSPSTPRNFNDVIRIDINTGDVEDVEAGDLDGDGKLDLVVTHLNNNDLSVWHNYDGTGRAYTNPTNITNLPADPGKPVLANMDGDNDLDIVTLNRGSNTVSVRYNNDNSLNFTIGTNLTMGDNKPFRVSTGDVDGDGDLDILTANRQNHTVSVRLNNGSPSFSNLTNIFINPNAAPADLVVADLDGDGDLDFATLSVQDQGIIIRYNDNRPYLPTITAVSPANGMEGDTILISGTEFTGLTGVSFNGVVPTTIEYLSPTQIKIIIPPGNVYGLVQVTTQNGTGTAPNNFQPPISVTGLFPKRNALNVPRSTPVKLTYEQGVGASSRVEVFSFQAGGRKTISGSHFDNSGNGVLTVDLIPQSVSGNTLTTPAMSFKPGEVVQVIAPRQTRGTDGRSIRPQVYQFTVATGGTGRGNFKPGIDVPVSENQYSNIDFGAQYHGPRRFGLVLADVAYGGHDGKLDIMMPLFMRDAQEYTAFMPIYVNDGNGVSFTDPESGGHNTPFQLRTTTNEDNPVFVGRNAKSYFLGTVAADLFRGGIGQLNVASSYYDTPYNSFLVHNIGPEPSNRISLTFSGSKGDGIIQRDNPTSVEAADLDGDADLDLVLGHEQFWLYPRPAFVSTVINDANMPQSEVNSSAENKYTTFRAGTLLELGGNNYKAKSADMNGDGTLDIITADYGYNSNGGVIIRLNTGNGNNFTAVPDVAVANKPFDLEVADVDGDGDLDILTTSNTERKVSIRLNNGDGTFAGGSDLSFTARPWDLATGDIDADGDLDIVVAKDDNFVSVRFNDGHGNFSGTTEVAVGTGPYSIALGDMDDDGDLDIVTANDNSFSVRLNEAFTDLTPLVYVQPTLQSRNNPISVMVDVVEVGGMASSGPITLKINRDALVPLSFNPALTSLNGKPVQNSVWTFSGPTQGFYTLTSSQVIEAGGKLSVGLSGVMATGSTSGTLTITSVLVEGSGGEVRATNNADAEKIDYFQQ